MKQLAAAALAVGLTSCAVTPYDTASGLIFVELSSAIAELECESETFNESMQQWVLAIEEAKLLEDYALFRNDPQVDTVRAISTNISAAHASPPVLCEHYLDLVAIQVSILHEVWGKR